MFINYTWLLFFPFFLENITLYFFSHLFYHLAHYLLYFFGWALISTNTIIVGSIKLKNSSLERMHVYSSTVFCAGLFHSIGLASVHHFSSATRACQDGNTFGTKFFFIVTLNEVITIEQTCDVNECSQIGIMFNRRQDFRNRILICTINQNSEI